MENWTYTFNTNKIKITKLKTLSDLDSLGATVVDPVDILNFSNLRKNQWCATFRTDVKPFLATYVKRHTAKTIVYLGLMHQHKSSL